MTPALRNRAADLLQAYATRGWKIAMAESCTGGLVIGLLTDIAGSSAVVERGFVTYSNEAKNEMIGVPMDLIAAYGAVSEPVAQAMAEGALSHSRADVTVGITGVAGPGGGSAEKPVGLVHFGLSVKGRSTITLERRYGDLGRQMVRQSAVEDALELLAQALATDGLP
ncbi:CinA family protein [Microvirga sp. 2MCAF38]|uniref:CinA family protein n=1 Tax=Microvirga sp. 2MCAF38 TaxID=3232989 RepID=UPI003F985F44